MKKVIIIIAIIVVLIICAMVIILNNKNTSIDNREKQIIENQQNITTNETELNTTQKNSDETNGTVDYYSDNYNFSIAQSTYSNNHNVYTLLENGAEDTNHNNYLSENGEILNPGSYSDDIRISEFEGTVKSAISIFNGDFGLEWPLYVLNTSGDVFYTLACVGENTYEKIKIKDNSRIVEIAISDKRNDIPVEKEMDNGLYPHNALVSREYFEILGKTVDGQIILLDEFVLGEEEIGNLGTLSKAIYSISANNLQVVIDHTTDYYNYRELISYDSSIYSGGEELAVKYIEESQEYANRHHEENVVVYVSFSEMNYDSNSYILYTGRFRSMDKMNNLKDKVTEFMRSQYAHEPMNEKAPRYDEEKEYNLAISDTDKEYKVLATGAISSVIPDINTGEVSAIHRLYPGET